MTKTGGVSIVASAIVSSMMTAAIALPMGVTAVAASNNAPELDDVIAINDERFPEDVDLSEAELAALLEAISTDLPAEPEAEAELASAVTSTPAPTPKQTPETSATPTPEEPPLDELAIVIATPTTVAAPSPTVVPAPTPRPTPEPTPTGAEATPTPQARPTAEPTTPAERSPTPLPALPTPTAPPPPDPTAEPTPAAGATDVYAYVAVEAVLVEDEMATVYVKAVNEGPAATTDVVMTVNIAGGTVVDVAPDPFGWTCSGGGSSFVCNGSSLNSRDVGRNIVSVMPDQGNLVVEVSISHAAPDDVPGNNSTTATLPVEPG